MECYSLLLLLWSFVVLLHYVGGLGPQLSTDVSSCRHERTLVSSCSFQYDMNDDISLKCAQLGLAHDKLTGSLHLTIIVSALQTVHDMYCLTDRLSNSNFAAF